MIAMDHNFFFLFYSAGFLALSSDPGFSVCVCFEYFVCRLLGLIIYELNPWGTHSPQKTALGSLKLARQLANTNAPLTEKRLFVFK